MTHLDKRQKLLGKKVKALRKASGMTQTELADKLGVNKSSISLLESGDRGLKKDNILKIAKMFHIPAFLLESEEDYSDEDMATFLKLSKILRSTTDHKNTVSDIINLTYHSIK